MATPGHIRCHAPLQVRRIEGVFSPPASVIRLKDYDAVRVSKVFLEDFVGGGHVVFLAMLGDVELS